MTYQLPPPNKPVWPIVLACLVLAIGIAVAAVFIGMNLGDDDDPVSGSVPVTSSDDDRDEPADSTSKSEQSEQAESESPKDDESDQPEKSTEPRETEPKQQQQDVPGAIGCGGDARVLATRTPRFAASICRTAPGAYVYRGKSDDVDDGIVLQANRNAAGDWFASNEGYAYIIDGDTGKLTIRDANSEVVASENAIAFSAR